VYLLKSLASSSYHLLFFVVSLAYSDAEKIKPKLGLRISPLSFIKERVGFEIETSITKSFLLKTL
jgi:hypothetical protein